MSKSHKRTCSIGFNPKTGKPRQSLPPGFWKRISWNTANLPTELDKKQLLRDCMTSGQIAHYLTAVLPFSHFTRQQVTQWLMAEKIPGVFRAENIDGNNFQYVHKDIVEQILNAIETHPEISFKQPETLLADAGSDGGETERRVEALERQLKQIMAWLNNEFGIELGPCGMTRGTETAA